MFTAIAEASRMLHFWATRERVPLVALTGGTTVFVRVIVDRYRHANDGDLYRLRSPRQREETLL